MSDLGAEKSGWTTFELWYHSLSTLIAIDGDEAVVISAVTLAETVQADMSQIYQSGHQIAASCSEKFKRCRNQPHMNWVVIYIPELRCFVGIRRSHKSLR